MTDRLKSGLSLSSVFGLNPTWGGRADARDASTALRYTNNTARTVVLLGDQFILENMIILVIMVYATHTEEFEEDDQGTCPRECPSYGRT